MRCIPCLCFCLLLVVANAYDSPELLDPRPANSHLLTNSAKPVTYESEWAVNLKDGTSPLALEELGYEVLGQIADLADIYLVRHVDTHARHQATRDAKLVASPDVTNMLLSHPSVKWAEQQFITQQQTRAISDPLFSSQWHLVNTGQFNGVSGIDVNIKGAWDLGYTGTGVRVAIVDDGFQSTHPDLSPGFQADSSYSFNPPVGNSPAPDVTQDFHGTSAAGVAIAASNAVCGVGAAYKAQGAGIRLIAGGTTDATEASGLTYVNQKNHIYSNSWGPSDDGIAVGGPGAATIAALKSSTATGRGGKGSIYVWAAGNGATNNDNCNYDGYANSRQVIAVSAIGNDGKQSFYSEPCAALLVAAPSSSANQDAGIRTTDLVGTNGYSGDSCDDSFGGTSSACPLVAGITALVLQANPALTWRDVQLVLAKSARQNDKTDTDWTKNGAGFNVNHKYGFGLIDATNAVKAAKSHTLLSPEIVSSSATVTVGTTIPDFPSTTGTTASVVITDDITVEKVVFNVNINHPSSGDLQIVVTSPAGTKSVLSTPHAVTPALSFNGANTVVVGTALFGPAVSFTAVTGVITAAVPATACGVLTNCAALAGTIAYVSVDSSKTCNFTGRAHNVQQCGAVGMIVWDTIPGDGATIFTIPGTDASIKIPTVFLSYTDATARVPVAKTGRISMAQYPVNSYNGGWTMSTARSMGESAKGTWTVQVTDGFPGNVGTFNSIQADVYGSSSPTASFQYTGSAVVHGSCAVLVVLAALLAITF